MDTALILKIELDQGKKYSKKAALDLLAKSDLVSKLTCDLQNKPLFYVWRLIALSEVPFAGSLDYTKNIIDRVYDKLTTPFGFSLSRDEKMFLPCYNAMVISALCRLGYGCDEQVKNGVEWIAKYQPFERGKKVNVPGLKFEKYGGCFNETPCYIGAAKSVFALFNYQKYTLDYSFNEKLQQGTEYLLSHRLFKRMKKDNPITDHILDISFPESYHLNMVELVRFASEAKLLGDNRTIDAVQYLKQKRLPGGWKISFRYKAEGYVVFDSGRKEGEWVSYILDDALKIK